MSRKSRTLLAILVVELFLGGIWVYLAREGQVEPDRVTADYQTTLGSTMGMAMGAFLGFALLLYLVAAKNDRKG